MMNCGILMMKGNIILMNIKSTGFLHAGFALGRNDSRKVWAKDVGRFVQKMSGGLYE